MWRVWLELLAYPLGHHQSVIHARITCSTLQRMDNGDVYATQHVFNGRDVT